MINYELAKKLKDAGFPQKDICGHCGYLNIDYTDVAFIPTLSELIEACGEDLKTLYKFTDDIWEAIRKAVLEKF